MGVVGQLTSLASTGSPPSALTEESSVEKAMDQFAAGAALVDLLGDIQRAGPVVVVIDDAHWADHPSLQALTFVLRRLRVDRILTVVLTRDVADPHVPDGLHRLLVSDQTLRISLEGLAAAQLRDLSTQLCPQQLSLAAAERLRSHTCGNPLYARALLEQLPVTAFEASQTPLPAPHSFAMVVLARLAACPEEVQEFVAAASVLGTRCTVDQITAINQTSDPLGVFDQAIQAGLLVEDPSTAAVAFPHPLVHAAIYEHLGPGRRAGLHRRAAAGSADELIKLRHQARAAHGVDRELAATLASLGRRTAATGDWAAAREQLSMAARLAPAEATRQQLTLEAVECRLQIGEGEPATLADQVRTFTASGWRNYVLARLAFVTGRMEEVEAFLQDAWQRCQPQTEAGLAARIAGLIATLYILQCRGRDGAAWANQALRLAPQQLATDLLRFLELVGLGMSGHAQAALTSVRDLPPPPLATIVELDALAGRGLLRMWTDDLAGARQDLDGVLTTSHDRSALFRLTVADNLAYVEYRLGHWDSAIVHSEFALSIVEDAGQAWSVPLCRATAAVLAAGQGRFEHATEHAEAAQRACAPGCSFATAYAATAAAHVARARAQPDEVIAALDPLRPLVRLDGIAEPGLVGWQDLLADALVAAGEYNQAEDVLGPFEALAARRGRRSAMAAAARARGNLEAARGAHAAAESAFEAGLEHAAGMPIPFEQARLQLAYGSFLRRIGRRALAAEQLGAAHVQLARLDARPDLERCAREMSACGLTPARPHATLRPHLTPQELAVARLVAGGLTNQQVARELVISVKTVEYHLSHVYTKLGVPSRVHLGSRLGED
jgi:DNA-binding CsgD family transcriptional regulator/tetratricopeptide (TPR) repeat protein